MSTCVVTHPSSRSMTTYNQRNASFGLSTMKRALFRIMDSWVIHATANCRTGACIWPTQIDFDEKDLAGTSLLTGSTFSAFNCATLAPTWCQNIVTTVIHDEACHHESSPFGQIRRAECSEVGLRRDS